MAGGPRKRRRRGSIDELVRTVEIGPFLLEGPGRSKDSWIHVRVEVFRIGKSRRYRPLVWFRELFRLTPTLPLLDSPPRQVESDVDVSYVQDSLGFEGIRSTTIDGVVRSVFERVEELLQ